MKLLSHWPEATKHITAFVIGWGLISILLGLFFAFDMMEGSKEIIPSSVIPFIFKIATPTFLIGLFVLSIPLLIWVLLNKKNALSK
ncbi:MAG: hypothetical protein JJE09_15510 [Bacteroidia bacterium]|nr:hypothetical protein [Bacteroidia bacterium]